MKHHRHHVRTPPPSDAGGTAPPSEATAEAPPAAVPLDRETMVREAAYFLYESRGGTPGHEIEDWLRAEAEVERALGDRGAGTVDDAVAA